MTDGQTSEIRILPGGRRFAKIMETWANLFSDGIPPLSWYASSEITFDIVQ